MSLEDRFRQALADTLSDMKSRLEAEFDATVAGVRAQADEERTAALTAADEARGAALAEAKGAAQAELQSAFDTEKAALRAELETATAEAERQRQDAEAALVNARAQADVTVEAIRVELREAQAALLRQREEGETVTARLSAEFDAKASAAREQAEAAMAALRNEVQAATALYGHAVGAQQSGAARMLESVRALDGATSLSEVLDALTVGASRECSRAAMLVVKGDRLIGWRTLGFGHLDQEPRAIDIGAHDDGALATAVTSSRPATTGPGSALAAPSFAEAPGERSGLAVPLLVAGRPVAVLYADPGTSTPAAGWTSPVEILVRHASRCLEGLAVQRATASRAGGARVAASA